MTQLEEKIANAKARIKELEVLIKHWELLKQQNPRN
jgi:hypothetical protein|tara:strand:- start:162 stop:269 length:108 start_codon:yes stop_codon:yes gene_type:complete